MRSGARTGIAKPVPTARAAICMDFESRKVLYERNADLVLPVASMAKIMSTYLVFGELSSGRLALDTPVVTGERAAAISRDTVYSGYERFAPGGHHSVDALLGLVFTASGNASMVALAEHVAGSEAAFVRRMNAMARNMGIDAFFTDCCGVSADGDRGSARAMALLARRFMQDYPEVLRYSSLRCVSFQGEDYETTNLLLRDGTLPGIDGFKTGTSDEAGHCFTGTASRRGSRIIAVVMGAVSSARCMAECGDLLEYGFACH